MWEHPALTVTVATLALCVPPSLHFHSQEFLVSSAPRQETSRDAEVDIAVGDWGGLLDVEGGVRVVLHVRGEVGKLTGTLDSPDQKAMGVPLTTVLRSGNELRFTLDRADIEYTGTIDGDKLVGKLSQRGQDFHLSLKRISAEREDALATVVSGR